MKNYLTTDETVKGDISIWAIPNVDYNPKEDVSLEG
jgi:hypothetical protein